MSSQPYNTAQQPDSRQQEQDSKSTESVKSKKSASAFRTISEVADHLDVQQHVLRFWETKFSHVRPLKRGGGRRYYRPEDVALLETIHHLLYTEGYTIKGVQKLLKDKGKNKVVQNNLPENNKPAAAALSQSAPATPAQQKAEAEAEGTLGKRDRFLLQSVLGDLRDLKSILVAKK